jgi:hypothetical protein
MIGLPYRRTYRFAYEWGHAEARFASGGNFDRHLTEWQEQPDGT